VTVEDKVYSIAMADLLLLQGRRAEMDAGTARLAARLSAIERRLADLKLATLVREAVTRQLRFEKAIDGNYSELAALEVKVDETRKLSVRAPPAGLIYVHRRDADKALAVYATEIKAADAETAKLNAEVAKARKQMIDFETQAAKLEKLMAP
jgi:chromosome segregation ATPase